MATDSPVGDGASELPAISADGRFVVFTSTAANLVPGVTAGESQIYIRDRQEGTTELVSANTSGAPSNGPCYTAHVSGDGRYVVFHSHGTNLDGSDANGSTRDIYLRDRTTSTTERITVSSTGVQGNLESAFCAVSDDGRFVVFNSMANNLVAGDTNGRRDVFLRDRAAGTTTRLSQGTSGEANSHSGQSVPGISADGRFVVFDSDASNLVKGDTNNSTDAFVADRAAGTLERVSLTKTGKQARGGGFMPVISADGRFVAFASASSDLGLRAPEGVRAIFIRDRSLRKTEPVSVGPRGVAPDRTQQVQAVSSGGRVVSFISNSTNLVAGDGNGVFDAFIRDRQTMTTGRVSQSASGGELDEDSLGCRVSRDGSTIVIGSASGLVLAGDSNGASDVFAAPLELPAGNLPPIARAGEDQTVAAAGAKARIQLDGTASSDPEGTKLTYVWSRYGKKLSASSRPKLSLPPGVHTLTLTVRDKNGLLGLDDVVVTVTSD